MIYTEKTKKALKLCFEAHKDQVDKSGLPYVFHPFHLAEQMLDENTTIVALLHDVVEDTDYTLDDLRAMGFGNKVIEALSYMTHDPAVPYMEYVAKIRENDIARTVKLADLRHNSDITRLEQVDQKALDRVAKYVQAIRLLEEYAIADADLYDHFEFRTIRPEEAEAAAEIEAICFPPNEACSREMMLQRVELASDLFLVAVDRESGKLAGFLNGLATNETSFRDEFFTDARLHDPEGKNIMLCGLDVLPAYRKQGLARELVSCYCRREQERGRQRLILTCLASKVGVYENMGFRDLGEADSTWGGEKWHEMDCLLDAGLNQDIELWYGI